MSNEKLRYKKIPYPNIRTSDQSNAYLLTALIRLSDILVVLLSGMLVYSIYPGIIVQDEYVYLLFFASIASPFIFHVLKCYDDGQIYSGFLKVKQLAIAWAAFFCLLMLCAFCLKVSNVYSRFWAVGWALTSFTSLFLSRLGFLIIIRRLGGRGRLFPGTVVFGTGTNGQHLARHIGQQHDFCINLIGFIDDRKTRRPERVEGYPVVGTMDDLIAMVRQGIVYQILIALPWSAEDRIKSIVDRLAMLPIDVKLVPDLAGLAFLDRPAASMGKLHVINILDKPISGWSYLLKRMEDLVLAGIFLTLALPLMVMIAICIKLETRGPVLFRQKRYGYNNQIIEVFKFRTMYHYLRDLNCDVQTVENDPRVTRIGRFLRQYSLDEVPQLLNVLRGEMSIVGPRPHALNTKAAGRPLEEVATNYAARHRVKPGITGWAQVNGWRGQIDTVEKICNKGSS